MTDENQFQSNENGKNIPPPHHKPHDIPPHIYKQILRMSEKIARLEGMMEILLKQNPCHCEKEHHET